MLNPRATSKKLAILWVKRNFPVLRITIRGIQTSKISPAALQSRETYLCWVTYLWCHLSNWWIHADKAANGWYNSRHNRVPHRWGFLGREKLNTSVLIFSVVSRESAESSYIDVVIYEAKSAGRRRKPPLCEEFSFITVDVLKSGVLWGKGKAAG